MNNILWLILFAPLFNYGQINNNSKGDSSVVYGDKEWMIKNLNVSVFRNGDIIQEARTEEEWENAGIRKKAVWSYFDNDSVNGIKYGKLYNWYAVNDPRGLAPKGWHIPTKKEWDELIEHFGGGQQRYYIKGTNKLKPQPPWGTYMKSEEGWINGGNGNNQTGFSALPGGSRNSNGSFKNTEQWYFGNLGEVGAWWAADTWNNEMAWFVRLQYNEEETFSVYQNMTFGLSVRIVKGESNNSYKNFEKKIHILSADVVLDTISNDLIKKDSLVHKIDSKLPFTGVVKGIAKSGIIWYQNYVDGLKNGYYTSWYYPNRIKLFTGFLNGKMDGPTAMWSMSGAAIDKGSYINGNKDGLWEMWYDNGGKKSENNYINGVRHGLRKEWHDNGEKQIEYSYKEGKQHGLETRWYSNGNKMSEKNYVNGVAEGILTYWHSNGQLKSEEKTENGKHIFLNRWDRNGKKIDK